MRLSANLAHNIRTRKMVETAMLITIGIVLHLVEAWVPLPVQIPGVKLGLANVVTLVAFFGVGHKEAFIVATVRVIFGSILAGTFMTTSLFMSMGGALSAFFVILLVNFIVQSRIGMPGLSALASLGHVSGQLLVAALIINHRGIFLLAPIIYLSAVITGFVTGIIAELALRRLINIGYCQGKEI